MTAPRTRYEFGDFVLDVGQQRLLRRESGETIALTSKVYETLACLVEHAGETLDKDVLLRAIWPEVVVEENSLTQNISTLRQVLGETRGENRYIATISRKGYRFVARVTRQEDAVVFPTAGSSDAPGSDSVVGPKRRRPGLMWAIAGVVIVLIAMAALLANIPRASRTPADADRQTIAILPFKPLVPAEQNASLELGMAESLISSLGQHGSYSIAPLSSVRRFSALDQDPIAAGRELQVGTVLDGSLQRRGDRLRVSVRLLRVADGRQLWAQSFDQEFTTIFEVQDLIAAKVTQALAVRRVGSESLRGVATTQDAEAYALYMSGRFAWTRQSEQDLLRAIEFFEQAVARDPNYALAYTGLADSYAVLGVFGMRAPHEVFPRAMAAAEKALSIDPTLAAAHSALGHILLQYQHDPAGAQREYQRAIDLDPTLALTVHRCGLLSAMQGDFDLAVAASAKAQQLEPLWLAAWAAGGNYLYYARRYDESLQLVEQVLQLDERIDNARGFLIRNLIATGNHERAIAEYDERPLQTPGSNAFRAQALALAGRRDEALAELTRVLKKSRERYVAAHDVALIYAALGDTESTFHWLERAMEDRSTLLVFLAHEPGFDALHGDPRFASLVRRIGISRDRTEDRLRCRLSSV
ncbi:winged helix-turn-helix domain-containing protein [Povalibacter sp.]|uniref:winged helix-turn-helix domain-containing protein n=1 Tax=Povalibacter sp. TaxID=1962978 RepID=UPI002F40A4D7